MSDAPTLANPDDEVRRRAAAAERLRTYNITRYVLAALPEHGSPPMGAVEICKAAHYGARSTVRVLLCSMVTLGIAQRETVPAAHGGFKHVYTRSPALADGDDFERATLVYGDGQEC